MYIAVKIWCTRNKMLFKKQITFQELLEQKVINQTAVI